MVLFGKWIAAALYGRAIARFHQKKYEEAARLLKKVCELDPEHNRREVYFAYLGRSYLALERYDDALQLMALAYERYRNRVENIKDEFERREFKEFLNAYIDVLRRVGQIDRAEEILREAGNRQQMGTVLK